MPRTIAFTIGTLDKAQRLYRTGLKHRILPLPAEPGVGTGDVVEVDLLLKFTGDRLRLTARVMHCSPSSTMVQLDTLPAELLEALGEATAPEAPAAPSAPPPTPPTPPPAPAAASPPAPEPPPVPGPPPAAEPPPAPSPTPPEPKAGPGGRPGRGFKLSGPRKKGAARPKRPMPGMTTTQRVTIGGSHDPADEGIPVPGKADRVLRADAAVKGTLDDRAMREVFMELLRAAATGVLVVDGYRERYWAFLVEGRPMRFHRDPPSRSDALEYQVSRAQLVEATDLKNARRIAELTGVGLEVVLQRMGVVDDAELERVIVQGLHAVTDRLLGVNYGTWAFYELPGLDFALSGAAADVMKVLWDRAREKFAALSDKQVAQRIDQYHKSHILLTDEGRELTAALSLGKRELYFAQRYLRGGWQLAELLGRVDLTNRAVMEILLTMQELGIIELSEREGPNWRLQRAERFLIDRMDYLGRDHFAFVDAHWSALDRELLDACDKVARTLDDPVLNELDLGRVGEMRRQIREKLEEVRVLFADRDPRRDYRAGLIEKSKLSMAASLFAKKGEMALFKREAVNAKECFERVLEVDPVGPGAEYVARARRVLGDIGRGVLTEATETRLEEYEMQALGEMDRRRGS